MLFTLTVLFFASHVASDACSSGAEVPENLFERLLSDIRQQTFQSGELSVLAEFLNSTHVGFTGAQTAQVVSEFKFGSTQESAIDLLGNYILSLTAGDVASILSKFTFTTSKLDVLLSIANSTLRSSIEKNSSVILDQFSFKNDKAAAQRILDGAGGRTCTWGAVNEPLIVFVIDTSGSMSTTFRLDGVAYTRLEFVQKEIDQVIRKQLRSDQLFNVISFSADARIWAPGLQPVTAEKIDSAVTFAAGLRADGGTYSKKAFAAAFAQSADAIYFLGDGSPSDGVSSNLDLIKALQQQHGRVPIYTTALAADSGGKQFLKQVAELTGGVYREINGN